jgi:signal transduction histidine kinase
MAQRVRVLLVDDDQDDYLITRDLLSDIEGWEFDVDWTPHYTDALGRIERTEHDVYLIDYRLGERTGLSLLEEAMAAGCRAPIILMTGQGDREVDLAAMAAGAADYLNKSQLDAYSLERAIRYSLERCENLEALRASKDAMRRYADELEERNRELDAYSHTIAHDLKVPLAVMSGYAELVKRIIGPDASKDVHHYLSEIMTVSREMGSMIEQLLQLASLRNASAEVVPLDMKSVLSSALRRFTYPIEVKNVKVEVAPLLPNALGHAPWVEEIFANLISNAIKYMGPENSEPRILIRGDQYRNMVRYEVEDNGIGIAAENQRRVFEMFSRAGEVKVEGTGLGLAIVQRMVSKLQGDLGVVSAPRNGSTFWFTLPAPLKQ